MNINDIGMFQSENPQAFSPPPIEVTFPSWTGKMVFATPLPPPPNFAICPPSLKKVSPLFVPPLVPPLQIFACFNDFGA